MPLIFVGMDQWSVRGLTKPNLSLKVAGKHSTLLQRGILQRIPRDWYSFSGRNDKRRLLGPIQLSSGLYAKSGMKRPIGKSVCLVI